MEQIFVYYAYDSRGGHTYCIREALNPYLMTGDYLLFDTAADCIRYWKDHGIEVDRYA